jgi:hypothetical protein
MAKTNKASANRQGSSGKSSSKGGGRSGGDIDKMFEALGVSGSVASSGAAKGFDAEELLDKARSYVNTQMEAAKNYVAANPKAVYGTLASVVVGAGLLTAAALKNKSSAKKSSSKSSSSKGGSKASSSRKSTGSSAKKSSGSKGSSKKSSSKSSR